MQLQWNIRQTLNPQCLYSIFVVYKIFCICMWLSWIKIRFCTHLLFFGSMNICFLLAFPWHSSLSGSHAVSKCFEVILITKDDSSWCAHVRHVTRWHVVILTVISGHTCVYTHFLCRRPSLHAPCDSWPLITNRFASVKTRWFFTFLRTQIL